MIAVESRVRRWGNSFGLLIPREKARLNNIKVGEKVEILVIRKGNVLRKMFGSFKFKEPVEKIMKESDKLLYND